MPQPTPTPQKMPFRQSYLAVSIPVTGTAQKLSTIIETVLGLGAGSFTGAWREVQFQVDPETSSSATIRIGNGNLGSTVDSVVQKGVSLVGSSAGANPEVSRAIAANVDTSLMWVMTVTGNAVLNCQFWAY